MSGLTLRLRQQPSHQRLNLRGITPTQLALLSKVEIEKLRIQVGEYSEPQNCESQNSASLADWFDVVQSGSDATLTLQGDLSNCEFIGAELNGGCLVVDGNAGDFVGHKMKSGSLKVLGNVGDYACSQMRGGQALIEGNAGDYAGGAVIGGSHGLRGGTLVIQGNAGMWAAHRMRRGLFVIHGSCEAGLGMRMVAGTVVCCASIEPSVGCGMRRGSIILLSDSARQFRDVPGFAAAEESELSYLPILLQHVRQYLPLANQEWLGAATNALPRRALRSVGDRSIDGLGELLFVS